MRSVATEQTRYLTSHATIHFCLNQIGMLSAFRAGELIGDRAHGSWKLGRRGCCSNHFGDLCNIDQVRLVARIGCDSKVS